MIDRACKVLETAVGWANAVGVRTIEVSFGILGTAQS